MQVCILRHAGMSAVVVCSDQGRLDVCSDQGRLEEE